MLFHSREKIRTCTGIFRETELKEADSGSTVTCLLLVENNILFSHFLSSRVPWCGMNCVPPGSEWGPFLFRMKGYLLNWWKVSEVWVFLCKI